MIMIHSFLLLLLNLRVKTVKHDPSPLKMPFPASALLLLHYPETIGSPSSRCPPLLHRCPFSSDYNPDKTTCPGAPSGYQRTQSGTTRCGSPLRRSQSSHPRTAGDNNNTGPSTAPGQPALPPSLSALLRSCES